MATEILMPALSPTMEEGTLAKWLVKEGDTVQSGDLLAEIETDKATMEFEAVDEGIVGRILVPEGTEGVKVNTPIAILVEEGEDADAVLSPAQATPPAADTTSPETAAETRVAAPQSAPAAATAAVPTAAGTQAGRRIFATPLARRIAAEKGLDLSTIAGTGPHGRIIKADVEAASPAAAAPAGAASAPAASAPAKPTPPTPPAADQIKALFADRVFEEVPLDGMRKTIAARLTEAKQTIPHFYLRRSIRLDPLLKLRGQLNAQLADRGIKLSVNDFIIKACALALQEVPDANAVWAGDRILRMKASDVAVAVAIDGGLFTPVLRDAESRTLSALSAQMKDLAARARDRKLAPHEYQGGSFSISNLGMFGIENFDAVINPPHGSILAVGTGVRQPIVGENGELATATMMSVTLSCDHRVIDGALGARFLEAIARNIENPMLMLA